MDCLTEDCGKVSQPINLNIELMEHQKTAIYAMKNIENCGKVEGSTKVYTGTDMDFNINTTVGILADKVGSGKSLMIISLILSQKCPPKREIFWEGSRFICITAKETQKYIDTNLLIIPHKLLTQWVDFFKYAPGLKVHTCASIEDFKELDTIDKMKQYDVIILTCSKSKEFYDTFGKIGWSRIIIDEADSIQLPKTTVLNCAFLWLVTATPKGLRYVTKPYLGQIFRDIVPWCFNYLIIKNDQKFLDESIKLPTPKRIVVPCLTPRELDIIKTLIPNNIVSMINAGNTQEAVAALNCNVDTKENILKVVTNNILEFIDNKKIELEYENKKKYKVGSKSYKEQQVRIKQIKTAVEKSTTKYESIKEKILSMNDELCPICMDEFDQPTLLGCCKNIFCFECITFATKDTKKCPFCRQSVYKEDFNIISSIPKKKKNTKELREKIDVLKDIVINKPDGKFLIFANFPATFDKIKTMLTDLDITYGILKGTSKVVSSMIDDFSKGKINVLMLNAKYFGPGMNLQMTTDIVVYHRFSREMEEQIVGRAQRLGRKGALNVYYLMHDNENDKFEDDMKYEDVDFEEWMDQLVGSND